MWRYGLFDRSELKTSGGQMVTIQEAGRLNRDSGPDFSDARIQIGKELWAGNVEIHFKSSDWDLHAHSEDSAYESVILHVVIHHDRDIVKKDGTMLPTLSLSSHLSIDHFRGYDRFVNSRSWVACENQVADVDPFLWFNQKERMAIERLELRSQKVLEDLNSLHGNWEELCYRWLARTMGAKVNAEPFSRLVRITPLELVLKHRDSDLSLEALFLGQSGLLTIEEGKDDPYVKSLHTEYSFLAHKYSLKAMDPVAWKNARIRPSSAPAIRVVQFSRLWTHKNGLHSELLDADAYNLKERFSVSLDGYWKNHIAAGKESATRVKRIGDSLKDRILINVVAPIRFAYGLWMKEQRFKDSALSLLESVKAEDNRLIRNWIATGVSVDSAFESQSLLHLKAKYCDEKKCLHCAIGQQILKGNDKLV